MLIRRLMTLAIGLACVLGAVAQTPSTPAQPSGTQPTSPVSVQDTARVPVARQDSTRAAVPVHGNMRATVAGPDSTRAAASQDASRATAANNSGDSGEASLTLPVGDTRKSSTTGLTGISRAEMIGTTIDASDIPVDYGAYSDERLEELKQQMAERDWSREDTAWQRACDINTKASYEKYVGMYPYGPHRAEASKRLVDIAVEDVFNGSYSNFPGMNHVDPDLNSPSSTVVVENFTQYVLTVMYSGTDSRSIRINPGDKGTVTLTNGDYRIAASVPPAYIKPFAGTERLCGGRYEVGFYVVHYGFH